MAEGRFGEKWSQACADCSVLGIAMKTSNDGGKTWSKKAQWVVKPELTDPNDPTSNVGGNPVLVYDETRDRIILHFVRGISAKGDCVPGNSNWEIETLDQGQTWSEPREISKFLGEFVGVLPGPGTGIQLKNGEHKGRLIIPAHYETAFRSDGVDIIYFSDDGVNWNVTQTPLPLMDESTITEVGNDGDIIVNMRST